MAILDVFCITLVISISLTLKMIGTDKLVCIFNLINSKIFWRGFYQHGFFIIGTAHKDRLRYKDCSFFGNSNGIFNVGSILENLTGHDGNRGFCYPGDIRFSCINGHGQALFIHT